MARSSHRPRKKKGSGNDRRAPGWASSWALVSAFLLTACGGPLKPEAQPTSWLDAPLTWDKLQAIESWLESPAAGLDRTMRIEAELQLAEGRLSYALRDLAQRPGSPVAQRLSSARSGFELVRASSAASSNQRERARMGLDHLGQAERPKTAGLEVRPRSSWNAASPNTWNIDRANGRWSRITVHHTAMPARNLRGVSAATAGYAIAQIQSQHMDINGWADLGYHFMIDPDGRVWEGRSLQYVGAHASRNKQTGVNQNIGNIGVCLLGNFEQEDPSSAALASLESLLDGLRQQFGIPHGEVYGHNHFKATDCPGQRLLPWVLAYQRAGSGPVAVQGDWPPTAQPTSSYASQPPSSRRRIR